MVKVNKYGMEHMHEGIQGSIQILWRNLNKTKYGENYLNSN